MAMLNNQRVTFRAIPLIRGLSRAPNLAKADPPLVARIPCRLNTSFNCEGWQNDPKRKKCGFHTHQHISTNLGHDGSHGYVK